MPYPTRSPQRGTNMAQSTNQSIENIKDSSFATAILPKATPINNALQRPLKLAKGIIFKVLSGTNETV